MTEADLLAAARRGGSIEPEDDEPLPELPQVAIHEAGHVACAVALGLEVRSVHLMIGHRGGRTETGAEGRVMRAYDLEAGAVVALGGLAAEELLCENPTLGSVPDVREATELLIRRIEAGVDPEFTPVSRKAWNPAFGVGPIDPLMAPRVLAALSAARDQARSIVASQGAAIEVFAQELLRASILTGDALAAARAKAGWV
jgi:ATP-dependent Zn protease